MIVYIATNTKNNKCYIGATTVSVERRKSQSISHAKSEERACNFHNAIRKYGAEAFSWRTLCVCPDLESLYKTEQHYIALYNSIDSGYNMTSGGINCKMSTEACKKMSEAEIGKKHTEETKQKIRLSKIGIKRSAETIKKISDNNAHYWLGKHHSQESIDKLKKNHVGMLGKKHTLETRLKMSMAHKKRKSKA